MVYFEEANYDKAWKTYCSNGIVTDVLEQGKSQYGYRFPVLWAHELFKNINVQTVMYPEAAHRESGISLEYRSTTCYLRTTLTTLNDPTFDMSQEINEAAAEYMAILFDQASVQFGGQDGVKSLVDAHHHIQSHISKQITYEDLKALEHEMQGHDKEDLKWYMNSSTAIDVATLHKDADSYVIDQHDEYLTKVGVPMVLLEKQIVYNEYIDSVSKNNVPIILGNLKKAYVLDMNDPIYITRSKCKITDYTTNLPVDGVEFEITFIIAGRVIDDTQYATLQMRS